VDALSSHEPNEDCQHGLVFPSRATGPMRRSNLRRRVWLPSLVRAGLLGEVQELAPDRFRATWPTRAGEKASAEFGSRSEAVREVARRAFGAPRFHDPRHSYATWLVTDGVPVNVVRIIMGHEQTSTTLNLYTHAPADFADRVLAAFDDSAASLLPPVAQEEPDLANEGAEEEL
jgi:integrase